MNEWGRCIEAHAAAGSYNTGAFHEENLTTETALSVKGGSPADVDSGGRVALVEQHLLLFLTLPGPEKGLGGIFPERVQ